jgi:hypothetical protein
MQPTATAVQQMAFSPNTGGKVFFWPETSCQLSVGSTPTVSSPCQGEGWGGGQS